MGILDDAIKEHLELKRQHGADQSELKKLEDEAFGAAERPGSPESPPDPLAEAPTQFMTQPDPEGSESPATEPERAASTETFAPDAEAPAEGSARGRTEIADLQEPPVESAEAAEEAPAEEEPAMEHEAIAEPSAAEAAGDDEAEIEVSAGPSTEERHAISEHPTEMYDVEAELGDAEPADAEPEVHALADDRALSEEDEEFWDEKRLSDELDQALEAPVELQEPDLAPAPEPEPAPEPLEEPQPQEDAPSAEEPAPQPSAGHEDALDETPDFLEDSPEDDQLWFEQKPPKDFDFDD